MKIGVFAYNFEHKKTQEGLLWLYLNGYKPDVVFAADPVELKFYQSKLRVSPKGLKYMHPKDISERLGIPYHVVVHNSAECEALIKKYDLDVGVILGARIIKKNIIEAFKTGVLNMHPGMLPDNRGLDTLKWAILKNMKQGVSAHLIDQEIDRGRLILRREIEVFPDDTMLDIFLRIQNMEQVLMIESLDALKNGKKDFAPVGKGHYSQSVPAEEEVKLTDVFESYKSRYKEL